jgi:hypothetical protein
VLRLMSSDQPGQAPPKVERLASRIKIDLDRQVIQRLTPHWIVGGHYGPTDHVRVE